MPDSDAPIEPSVVPSVVMRVELPNEELRRIYQAVQAGTSQGVVTGFLTCAAIVIATGAAVYFLLPKR